MPRLSSYLLLLFTVASVSWAGDSLDQRDSSKKSASKAYYCPEQVGEEKWECDNKFCGGENPKKKGHCSLYTVQGGPSPDGSQYVLNRHVYCKCGPKSDGGGVKPPPIIPFPPPPPGFVAPPPGIPHPKNEDSCPEDFTETKCKDCKPVSGWCSEGPRAGCPCRDECPADDSKDVPSCSSEDCEGKDGKCTTGHYADCKCKDICPDNEEEFIDCADDECKSDDYATCKEGKYKGCKCLVGGSVIADDNPKFEEAVKYSKELKDVYENIEKYAPEAETKCPSSGYSDAVAIDKKKAYEIGDKFCGELDQSKKTSKEIEYKDFKFQFGYKPGDKCYSDCKDTIHSMVCSGYDDHSIQPENKATFKCGTEYSFKITKTKDKNEDLNAKRTCANPNTLGSHRKIDSDLQAKYGSEFCDSLKGKKIKKGDRPLQKQYLDEKERVWYGYSVEWEERGCDSSITELDAQYPLGKDHKNNCESLMRWTYKLCSDNDGIGGWYNVGCARFQYLGFNEG